MTLLVILISEPPKVGGLFFGDYYYLASSSVDSLENRTGFWLRRVYFNMTKKDENYEAMFRLEMNDPGLGKTGRLDPYIKDAYISIKYYQDQRIIVGIQALPAFNFIEDRWGFRFVQKTATDLYKFASSREYGIGFKGKLTKSFEYHFTAGNGNGFNSENDIYKKYALSLKFFPIENLALEVYGDYYENNTITIQPFISYNYRLFDIGVIYAFQQSEKDTLSFLSSYLTIKPTKNLSLILRYDKSFQENKSVSKESYLVLDPDSAFSYILVGLSYKIFDNFYVAPIFDLVVYDDSNISDERLFRFVFYYKF